MVAFVAGQPLELLHIDIVALAEIRFGIELVAAPARRPQLMDWPTHKVRPMFEQRALAVTEDIMFKWISSSPPPASITASPSCRETLPNT